MRGEIRFTLENDFRALDVGYQMGEVYEIWHYDQYDQFDGEDEDTGLFTKYVNTLLKLKIENSGWPSWVKTDADVDAYLLYVEKKEKIILDPKKIRRNNGLRATAKLLLNSFWGKFGQRDNLSKTAVVTDYGGFYALAYDPTITVATILKINDEIVLMTYSKEEGYETTSLHGNPVIAAFTTSCARLKLYEAMEQLQDRVLYHDTGEYLHYLGFLSFKVLNMTYFLVADSLIYLTDTTKDNYHPPMGECLGEYTNELEQYGESAFIKEFASGGPKNYSYCIQKEDGTEEAVCKIRGFTLSHQASEILNHGTMVEKVQAYLDSEGAINEVVTIPQNTLRKSAYGEVLTTEENKNYSIIYDKRVIKTNGSSIPFGYIE